MQRSMWHFFRFYGTIAIRYRRNRWYFPLANTKKTSTRTKKTASNKKTSAGTRRTASRSSGTRTTNTAARKRTGTGKTGSARRSAPKRQTQNILQTNQVWNNVTVGIGLLMLAVVLVLALCQMDGILLTGVLHLVGGLIGWGTQMFWAACSPCAICSRCACA